MATKRITKKQRDADYALAREEKLNDLNKEYDEIELAWKELNWPITSFDREFSVGRKMEEWERTRLNVPSGKYQDFQKVRAVYQQHFVKYLQECCPDILDELRILVPCFKRLFGEERDKYQVLFDKDKTLFLIDLQSSLGTAINHFVEFFPHLSYRSSVNGTWTFRHDFFWGESLGVLAVLRISLVDAPNEKRQEAIDAAEKYLEKHLFLQPDVIPPGLDEGSISAFLSSQAKATIRRMLEEPNEGYFASGGKRRINRFLEEFSSGDDDVLGTFVDLQISLLDWASRHNLEKDWLLRYAYYFLSKFDENPALTGAEIEVPMLQVRSLIAVPFEFKFESWVAGDEKKEVYESRLRASFEETLAIHFHNTFGHLNLGKKKRETGNRKYERVKWLVRWTAQEWPINEILEEVAGQDEKILDKGLDNQTLPKAFKTLQRFDLPYRQPM